MGDKPKIVYDVYTSGVELGDIKKDAIKNQVGCFLSMCLDSNAEFWDVAKVMTNIRYLHLEEFTNEEPRLLSYEEIENADVLLCWCEEICYDPEWAEDKIGDTNISDWVVPCIIADQETFTCSGRGSIGLLKDYGKVRKTEDGCLIGLRYWSSGKRPTFEKVKSEEWEGLEGYEYE